MENQPCAKSFWNQYSTVAAPHPKATVSIQSAWADTASRCAPPFSHSHSRTHTQLTYMKAIVRVLGSQQGNHNLTPFTSYNINICFDLVGRVEILLGKLLHYGFSIRHPRRQNWKCDKLTERDILMLWKTYASLFLPILQRVHLRTRLFLRSVRKDFVLSLGNASLELM